MIHKLLRNKWILLGIAMLVGALIVLSIRFATYSPPKEIHYHANFAVYINGEREPFKAVNYYEETAASSCGGEEEFENTSMSRTHMHANVNDVVHIEDEKVTWGNFFTVLGWNVGKTYLATRDQVYVNNDKAKVTYVLNGKPVDDIANLIIGDLDKLLINYGTQTSTDINNKFNQIQNNALKANQSGDPASCGSHSDSTSIMERMKHMF